MALMVFSLPVFAQTLVVSDVADDTVGAASAVLDLKSSTKGFLPPRMSEIQRTSINNPAEGLIVYQTDGAEGLYYFKDSSWSLINTLAGSGTLNPVLKTVNDTIEKSETMILASNDIMLVLPAITAADDGLAITVKNIGSHKDLVTVIGNNGALIDSASYTPLPRWFSTTVVAKNGHWYFKQRTIFPANTLQVSWHSPWRTLQEAMEFLEEHMWGATIIELESDTFMINETITINLPYPLTIKGSSYSTTTIVPGSALSGQPMFVAETESYFKSLDFDGNLNNYGHIDGEDAIQLTGTDEYYEIKDCGFRHFRRAIAITTNLELWLFENDIIDATAAGVEVAAGSTSGVFFKVSETDFIGCKKGINLLSGTNALVSILNCGFYHSDTVSTGIVYEPATFTDFESVVISSNTWNHVGEFIEGFDFSRADGRDKEFEIMGNVGEENQSPHVKLNLINNTATFSSGSGWTKANWNASAQSSIRCKFTVGTNRVTYQPISERDLIMWISGNVVTTSGSNKTTSICVVKNGNSAVKYGETSVKMTSQGAPYQWSTVVYLSDIQQGDYFEVWTSMGAGNETLIMQDLNWFTNSQ
jgi:hypothetical protein